MKTAAIIAEYNPFHNGHFYQIQKLHDQIDADFVIALMSGDFVQRGEPAVYDKYTRTYMALNSGIDLVLERRRFCCLRCCFAGPAGRGGCALLWQRMGRTFPSVPGGRSAS